MEETQVESVEREPLAPAMDGNLVHPYFTRDEAGLLLALIKAGWTQGTLGSRRGFEMLASIEDKMLAAGAEPIATGPFPPVQ